MAVFICCAEVGSNSAAVALAMFPAVSAKADMGPARAMPNASVRFLIPDSMRAKAPALLSAARSASAAALGDAAIISFRKAWRCSACVNDSAVLPNVAA